MLKVNLADLARAGAVPVQREIAAGDPFWEGMDLELDGPVAFDFSVSATPTGQVVARGTMSAEVVRECRRCLARVERDVQEELTLVWAPPDELGEGEDAEIRPLPVAAGVLDLGPALREELILAVPQYVVCREECRGLCPRCGINRNTESCDCTLAEPDPRWDALRRLRDREE